MKWMIASDIHGSAFYCEKMLKAFEREQADKLLLLGDILYHGPRNDLPEGYATKKVIEMLNNIKEKILCVRGNCDAEVDGMVLEAPIQNPFAFVQWEGLRILLSHGHRQSVAEKEALAKKYKVHLFIEGHTHLPVLEKKDACIFLNPGSPCMPKTLEKRGTFGVLENGSLSIRYVDTGEIYQTMAL